MPQWSKFQVDIGGKSYFHYIECQVFFLLIAFHNLHRYFKYIRLAAVYTVMKNIHDTPAKHRGSENALALAAMVVWILNGAHRTPYYRTLGLAKEACPEVLLDEDDDPDDEDSVTIPLMYEGGTYFICDIVCDRRTKSYRIPHGKQFTPQFIIQAYEIGTMNELRHMLGVGDVKKGHRDPHEQRTSNRTGNQTMDVRLIRAADRPLPAIGRRLDGLPLPNPQHPRGDDVDFFHEHGGGNRQVVNADDDFEAAQDVNNPLKQAVQVILEQMFFDIIQVSPNKRSYREGAWTNIPRALRQQLAVEDLYLHLELPFEAVQYHICSLEEWNTHFNRFFPPEIPEHIFQNFGSTRYFHTYLDLVRQLTPQQLQRVRFVLKRKFDKLAWMPHTGSDRMWCTRKTTPGRWQYIPDGRKEGPKIAVNPLVLMRLGIPRIRPPPRIEDFREEEEEEEE